jgi:hypothetical protein
MKMALLQRQGNLKMEDRAKSQITIPIVIGTK